MTPVQTGMAVGATLAIVWIAFNFGWMLLVALAMLVGALVGLYIEGRLDVTGIVQAVSGRRRSS